MVNSDNKLLVYLDVLKIGVVFKLYKFYNKNFFQNTGRNLKQPLKASFISYFYKKGSRVEGCPVG